MRVKVFIFTALILLAGIVVTSLPRARAQKESQPSAIEQKLLEIAAKRDGSDPANLQVLNSTTVELPLTARHVQIAKVLDTRDSRVLSAAMDEQGQEVDFAVLKDDEERAHRARFGKLEPKLHKKVEGLRSDEKVKVAFWLNQPEDLDAQRLVRHEPCVPRGNGEIGLRQHHFHVRQHRREERPLAVHLLQQPEPVVAAVLLLAEPRVDGRAEPVPAGQHQPTLRPREHPRDRA